MLFKTEICRIIYSCWKYTFSERLNSWNNTLVIYRWKSIFQLLSTPIFLWRNLHLLINKMIVLEFSIKRKKIFDLEVCKWIKQCLISAIICANILLDFILALFIDFTKYAFFCFLLSAPTLLEKGTLASFLDCARSTIEKVRITIAVFCGTLWMIITNALSLASFSLHCLCNILKRKRVFLIVHALNSDYYR